MIKHLLEVSNVLFFILKEDQEIIQVGKDAVQITEMKSGRHVPKSKGYKKILECPKESCHCDFFNILRNHVNLMVSSHKVYLSENNFFTKSGRKILDMGQEVSIWSGNSADKTEVTTNAVQSWGRRLLD